MVWAGGAGAVELPARTAKARPAENRAAYCEIDGVRGFATPGGGCVRVGGYVSVGVSSGGLKR